MFFSRLYVKFIISAVYFDLNVRLISLIASFCYVGSWTWHHYIIFAVAEWKLLWRDEGNMALSSTILDLCLLMHSIEQWRPQNSYLKQESWITHFYISYH